MLWESLLRHPWGDDSVAATFAAASVFPEARLRKLLSMVRHEERPELGRMLALAGRAAAAKTAPAGGGGGGSAGGGKRGGGGGIGSSAASVSDVVKKFVTKFGQRRCNVRKIVTCSFAVGQLITAYTLPAMIALKQEVLQLSTPKMAIIR